MFFCDWKHKQENSIQNVPICMLDAVLLAILCPSSESGNFWKCLCILDCWSRS
jgi:hypothetical protein